MTNVKFYKELGGILAVFPEAKAKFNGYRTNNITCYSHIGQHSECNPDYLKGKQLASPEEYNDLLVELKGQGYDDLNVIDSRKPLTRILSPVSCKYGAPMGRANIGQAPKDKPVFDSLVALTDGYDKGGAYWGIGNPLRVKYTKDLTYIEFYRA